MRSDRTHILVLDHDGAELLGECLPSVIEAARLSRRSCRVTVVENGRTAATARMMAERFPDVGLERRANLGLATFNEVLAALDEPVVLLLNNDLKLDPSAVDPLVDEVEAQPDALFAAPQCWTFDGRHYEGMRTRVRSRYGLVQGLCRVPGHEELVDEPGLTAAAGPVLAVRRERFLALGGFDSLYFPGRIEDLDLGFRGWMAGWRGYYVPGSLAYHRGMGTFGPAFGAKGCDRLTARNTMLFAWSNLGGLRLAQHLAWLPARVLHALAHGRPGFVLALKDAIGSLPEALERRRSRGVGTSEWIRGQESYFRCFRW